MEEGELCSAVPPECNGIVAIAVNTNRQRFPLCQTLPFPTRYKINIKGKKTNLPHFAWLKRLYKYALTTWGYIYLQNVHPCPRHSPSIFCQQAPGELWGCDRAWLWIFSTFIIGPEPPHSTLNTRYVCRVNTAGVAVAAARPACSFINNSIPPK